MGRRITNIQVTYGCLVLSLAHFKLSSMEDKSHYEERGMSKTDQRICKTTTNSKTRDMGQRYRNTQGEGWTQGQIRKKAELEVIAVCLREVNDRKTASGK